MTNEEPITELPEESTRVAGESLEEHCRSLEEEIQTLRESEIRLKQQYAESQRREKILVRRLAAKEQEMQDYATQIAELKSTQVPNTNTLRSTLLDPAINILCQKLKSELQSTKAKLEETQNELSAWKFTPDSNTGKRLMAKCRLLYQENEELGKMTSNGRLAKLEGDLALQKSFGEEVKKSQSELDDFLQELDEDVEGMQSTILFLQHELKVAKDRISVLDNEVILLKDGNNNNNNNNNSNNNNNNTNDILKNDCRVLNGVLITNDTTINNNDTDLKHTEKEIVKTSNHSLKSNITNNNNNNNNIDDNISININNNINNNSERLIKKDNLSTSNIINNETRTLRSNSRMILAVEDCLKSAKNFNINKSHSSTTTTTITINNNNNNNNKIDDLTLNGGNVNNNRTPETITVNNYQNNIVNSNKKRRFDDSDSSDCSNDNNPIVNIINNNNMNNNKSKKTRSSSSSGSNSSINNNHNNNNNNNNNGNRHINNINNNKRIKRSTRRSSVLSLDLDEEDCQIDDLDDDRTIKIQQQQQQQQQSSNAISDV